MQRTINLPDELAESLDVYLREHPSESISSLIQAALTVKIIHKDNSKLLQLAGMVTEAPYEASDHAEDRQV